MAALQQHIAAVKRAYFSQDAHALLAAFRIDPGTFGAIQADLNRDVSSLIVRLSILTLIADDLPCLRHLLLGRNESAEP